jgi:hypothetical protein
VQGLSIPNQREGRLVKGALFLKGDMGYLPKEVRIRSLARGSATSKSTLGSPSGGSVDFK